MITSRETRESHWRTAFLSALVLFLPAFGKIVYDNTQVTTQLVVKVESLQIEVLRLRSDMDKATDLRYKVTDAQRDFDALRAEFNRRFEAIERR